MPLSPEPVNVTFRAKRDFEGFCLLFFFFKLVFVCFAILVWVFVCLFVLAAPHIAQDLVPRD